MKRAGGFTLIEGMVVVIIGLLASVLIPRFAHTREQAFMASMVEGRVACS